MRTCLTTLLLLCQSFFVAEAIEYIETTKSGFLQPTPRRVLQQEVNHTATLSAYFQWESSLWPQRNIDSHVSLDLSALDEALQTASGQSCNLGITATLFDYAADSGRTEPIYQRTVGSSYSDLSLPDAPLVSGWTADTTFALYSNSKIFATTLYMKAVVEAGLGYLDEPLHLTLTYLNATSRAGRITPRHILSHRSGLPVYNRNDAKDPFYSCINNATIPLDDCLQEHLLVDAFMLDDPGATVRYSNDPFYIMASLIVKKTAYNDIDQALQAVIVDPLRLSNATSYECPLVGSTAAKPHVSWGVCSTGRDVPKLLRELLFYNQSRLLSAESIGEILSFQVGTATNADRPLPFGVPLGNCLSRSFTNEQVPSNALIGYGLGTMIAAGVKGIHFVHAATVGGYWVVAPHRYALYLAFMGRAAFPRFYVWMAWIVDQLERASTVRVKNSWENETFWHEVTPCVDGMFVDTDLLEQTIAPVPCPDGFGSVATTTAPSSEPSIEDLEQDLVPSASPTLSDDSSGNQRMLSTSTTCIASLVQVIAGWLHQD